MQAANKRDQTMDDEYAALMAELGGGNKSAIAPQAWAMADTNEPIWMANAQKLGGATGKSIQWEGGMGQRPTPPSRPAAPSQPADKPLPPSVPAPSVKQETDE